MFGSIKIAFVIAIIGLAGGGFLYVKNLQSNLETARANVAKMEVAIQISEASVATLQKTAVMNEKLNSKLQKDLQQAEKYGDELRSTLQKHNLTYLANKKPGLIEKRMQNATNKLWVDLTKLTDNTVGVQHDEQVSAGAASSNSN